MIRVRLPVGIGEGASQLIASRPGSGSQILRQLCRRQRPIRFNLNERYIDSCRLPNDLRLEFSPVVKRHTQVIGIMNDMLVRCDKAIGADDEAGPFGALDSRRKSCRGRFFVRFGDVSMRMDRDDGWINLCKKLTIGAGRSIFASGAKACTGMSKVVAATAATIATP